MLIFLFSGFSPLQQDDIHRQLLNATDFIEASVFNSPKQYAMNKLQQAWIRYLKEDLKGFLEYEFIILVSYIKSNNCSV